MPIRKEPDLKHVNFRWGKSINIIIRGDWVRRTKSTRNIIHKKPISFLTFAWKSRTETEERQVVGPAIIKEKAGTKLPLTN